MVDASYREFLDLISRAFTEEFDDAWQIIRTFCIGLLVSGIMLLITAFGFMSSPDLDQARATVSKLGLSALGGGVFFYFWCSWKAYKVHLLREHDKNARYRSYDQ